METVAIVLIVTASVVFTVKTLLRTLGYRGACRGGCAGCSMKYSRMPEECNPSGR